MSSRSRRTSVLAFPIYRRPDLAYLRSKDRDADLGCDTFVGLVAAPSDPTLAETAWHRALAAGSPRNRLCLASGAQLALAQGRPEAALDFWYEAEHNGGSEPLDPLLAYRVMIANYKLEQARDLARKHPKLFPNIAEGLESSSPRIVPDLLKSAAIARAERPGTRHAPPRCAHRPDRPEPARGKPLSPPADKTRRISHRSASDHFSVIDLQMPQGLRDFELRPGVDHGPTDKRRASFVKLVRLDLSGVRKTDGPVHAEATLIGHVELEVPSGFSLRNCEPGDDVNFPDPLVAADGKVRNAIRFLRVGGQMEVFVNERRVIYQPILPDVMLQASIFRPLARDRTSASLHWTN